MDSQQFTQQPAVQDVAAPEVADQLGVLDGSLDLLSQAIDTLSQRLTPVMHDTLSTEPLATVPENPSRSMIGGRIRGARERVAEQTSRIEMLTQRLEV